MRLKLMTLVLFAAFFGGQIVSGRAQSLSATPQPQQAFIQEWSQEIIFPAAVRFNLTIALPPPQVTAVTLTIKPENRAVITLPLDLSKAVVVGGTVTGVVYIWTIPADTPPLLFGDITFDWQVTSDSNQNAKIEDVFTFTDQRANWLRDVNIGASGRLTFANGKFTSSTVTPAYSRTGIDNLTANLEHVSQLLMANLGTMPVSNLLVYDTTQMPFCIKNAKGESVAEGPISQYEVACQPETAEQIFADSGYTVLKLKAATLENIQSAVSDYIVQQAYAARWANTSIPRWFQAGLTEFYSPASKVELNAPVITAARSNNLLPLDVMAKSPDDSTNLNLWRSESYGLVVYIAAQIGVDGLFKLANDAATASSFDAAYQTALGNPADTLLGSFGRWLFSDAASGAFTFTVYQEATPSPTPSRTATFTLTPTPTNTATITPTATVTGALSPTPLPSRTPTLTPTEAPATNTPRPAGSLNTLTPTPSRTSLDSNVPNTSLTIGIIILVVGAVIVVVAAFILFRPRR